MFENIYFLFGNFLVIIQMIMSKMMPYPRCTKNIFFIEFYKTSIRGM